MAREIQVRVLGEADIGLILHSDAFDNRPGFAETRAFLKDDGHLIVGALQGAVLIGFASATVLLHPDKPPAMFIAEVGVNESHRRQGIGKRLGAALIALARARGCQGVWLATEADNVAARALYRALGARETGGIVVYDWDGAMDG